MMDSGEINAILLLYANFICEINFPQRFQNIHSYYLCGMDVPLNCTTELLISGSN